MVTLTLIAISGNRVINSIQTQSEFSTAQEFQNMWNLIQNDEDFPLYSYSLIIHKDKDDYDFAERIINWTGTDIPNFLKP